MAPWGRDVETRNEQLRNEQSDTPEARLRRYICLALDRPSVEANLVLARQAVPRLEWFKVGLVMYTQSGPGTIAALRDIGGRVFLDIKLHDIPTTVAGAVAAARTHGVELLTVHAAGGRAMLKAAAEAAEDAVKILAVTILTSSNAKPGAVLERALLAQDAGCAGIVCSALEAADVRRRCGPDFFILTPGIRLPGDSLDDQKRVATPDAAVRGGSNLLVVGRPIHRAPDLSVALNSFQKALGHD